ncbi:hypothetical protein VOLCADRAFT_94442 [Volvox carteri f. nagariensis]|uniref:Uncharacterized protein n=1 Tax=Volvox carteri f. nagariensis TaxID=3068 RepID=D8U4T6_VOLCA|nr:uncharacterized protein VOLCADRAFT_94442 [Volvox carteri f. nagariensis]EFJ45332.1 hypothetical protein VOLCADRAFT_94442 [Volvox carteri f. nagariensis]|eukprot:XP_002953708.1 hypothetical protein VOLCADRAFT_94442 [Volvox carteri f. nagariensis]
MIQRIKGGSSSIAEASRLLPTCSFIRGFRADATDPETRSEDACEDQCCKGLLADPPAYRGPIRTAQPRKGERRKALPVLAGDQFTSNVATLLPPLTEGAVQGLKALAASGLYNSDSRGAGGPATAAGTCEDAVQYDAHQAALSELLDRLQALQQHLQDFMSDDGSRNGTIVALATITEEDGDEPGGPYIRNEADSQDVACSGPEGLEGSASSDGRVANEGSGSSCAATMLGRWRRRPAGWQQGPRPAPPWDDTQPFQTHVGTVYHFWRLCPYG